jgi:hypothetical protein
MLTNISFSQYIVGQLRKAIISGDIIDYNLSNRSANYSNWIFPDRPMITKLMNNKNNFPRVSIETLNMPTVGEIGMGISDLEQTVSLKISVWSVRDLICTVKNTVDETILYDPLIDIYELDNLPFSDITAVREGLITFVKNTDYQVKDNTGSGMRNSIEWLSGDKPTTSFDVTYKRIATGQELCRIIAADINKYLRGWRNWNENFWSYRLSSSNPVDFDEQIGVFRYELTIQFSGINIGDEI